MVLVIGLTGQSGSGKEYLKNYLSELTGFPAFSLSDVLRDDIKKLGEEPTRDKLIDLGNKLRKEHGSGFVARRVIGMMKASAVVDAFKNPGEVEEFRKEFGEKFFLISVQASLEKQFERVRSRGRENDPKRWEDFLELLEKHSSKESYGLMVGECDKLADYVIKNNDGVEELRSKAKALVEFLQ